MYKQADTEYRNEIIEMARHVGVDATGSEYWPFFIEELEAFAKLVAEAAASKEREACAELVGDIPPFYITPEHCAAAIRARSGATSRGEA